ncbi:phenazine biosynthesis-like domain protein [Streptococcus ictaluri 707-05]|uniref:Phenazine biosynthesis-like domain protein n=1 Tax=Streptococcus ictaluri 707-05 TaxID=764299 RepID=G5K398_9STRE|nr:phenazine biosynthesis-like domain protein [Streptococcus ictaluri 707-05]
MSKSGLLEVTIDEDIHLHFPKVDTSPVKVTSEMKEIFGDAIEVAFMTEDLKHLVLVLQDQQNVAHISFDRNKFSQLAKHGVTVTAKSYDNDIDYVLRYFAPNYGIDEDPVTGSAHTRIADFWSNKLKKVNLVAKQLSDRQGLMSISVEDEFIKISGTASLYLKGKLRIN